MSTTFRVSFACSICRHTIDGEYEEEDLEYPVFCPKCGRSNSIPRPGSEAIVPAAAETPAPIAAAVESTAVVPEVASVAPPLAAQPVTPPPQEVRPPAPPVPVLTPPPPVAVEPKPAAPPAAAVAMERPIPAPAKSVPAAPPRAQPAPVASGSRVAWRYRAPEPGKPPFALRNCAAVDDEGRVIAALGRHVVALTTNMNECDVVWKFAAADVIPGSPVIGIDGTVFVHSSDGLLHALDADGKPTRSPTKVGPALGWATPLVDDQQRVWISASAGGLIRVDAAGQTASRPFLRSPSRLDCTGLLAGDRLYIGSEDQFLHAVDLNGERGRELWNPQEKIGLTGWYINSAIARKDGDGIVAVSRDDSLYLFRSDGSVAWSLALEGKAIGSPVVASDGTIVVGLTTRAGVGSPAAGRLLGIDSKLGRMSWKLDLAAPIESTSVLGDSGEIYVGDNAGRVHAVDSRGRCRWSESVGAPVRSAGTILSTKQVLFGLDDGSLVAVRCDSQALSGGWPKLLGTAANRCPSVG